MSLAGIPGQIALGHLSDRIGREWVWTVGCLGFALCYAALLVLSHAPTPALLAFMVAAQGVLGYGLTSVIGAIGAEIFQGPHYGTIFGMLMLAAIGGGAAGPWVTGALYDATGSYRWRSGSASPAARSRRRNLARGAARCAVAGRVRVGSRKRLTERVALSENARCAVSMSCPSP